MNSLHRSDRNCRQMPWARLRGKTTPPPEKTFTHQQQLRLFKVEMASKYEADEAVVSAPRRHPRPKPKPTIDMSLDINNAMCTAFLKAIERKERKEQNKKGEAKRRKNNAIPAAIHGKQLDRASDDDRNWFKANPDRTLSSSRNDTVRIQRAFKRNGFRFLMVCFNRQD